LLKHRLTTLFGLLLALGGFIPTLAPVLGTNRLDRPAQILQLVGALGLGAVAADANKVKTKDP